MNTDTFNYLKETFVKKGSNPDKIMAETNLANDLRMDSLEMMDFIMEIEDHYAINIPMDAVSEVKTISNLVEVIDRIRNTK